MLQPNFTEEEITHIYQLFMEHPSGTAKRKLHVVYLKALGLPHQEIVRIARVSGDSVTRYLKAYVEGGVTALCSSKYYCCQWPTELSHFWPLILSHFSREKSLIQF